jgi:hypothetical protein
MFRARHRLQRCVLYVLMLIDILFTYDCHKLSLHLQRHSPTCSCSCSSCQKCKELSYGGPSARLLQLMAAADPEPWPAGLQAGIAALDAVAASDHASLLPVDFVLQEAT